MMCDISYPRRIPTYDTQLVRFHQLQTKKGDLISVFWFFLFVAWLQENIKVVQPDKWFPLSDKIGVFYLRANSLQFITQLSLHFRVHANDTICIIRTFLFSPNFYQFFSYFYSFFMSFFTVAPKSIWKTGLYDSILIKRFQVLLSEVNQNLDWL